MNSNESRLDSYLSSPMSLISFIKNRKDHWIIKNNDAKYVFVNDAAFQFFRFPKSFDPKGKSDKEVPTEICEELWPEFVKSDKAVIKENKEIKTVAIHRYGKDNPGNMLVPHLTE